MSLLSLFLNLTFHPEAGGLKVQCHSQTCMILGRAQTSSVHHPVPSPPSLSSPYPRPPQALSPPHSLESQSSGQDGGVPKKGNQSHTQNYLLI